MSMMSLQQQRENLADMSIRDYIWYVSLGKYGIRDMVQWMHDEGGYIGNDAALTEVCSVLYSHWHFPDRPKRNLLLIGDTGSGKTALIETIRRFMRYAVPSAPDTFQNNFLRYVSCVKLTTPGYHGLHLADALGLGQSRIDKKGCIHQLAVAADSSGLGGRYIRNEIQKLFDRQLLDHYDSDTLTL